MSRHPLLSIGKVEQTLQKVAGRPQFSRKSQLRDGEAVWPACGAHVSRPTHASGLKESLLRDRELVNYKSRDQNHARWRS